MIEPIILTGIGVSVVAVFVSGLLEQYGWFQDLPSETKRLLAVVLAALIALSGHAIELAATGKFDNPSAFSAALLTALAVTVQQVFHALTRQ
jgi:hypothetical protein